METLKLIVTIIAVILIVGGAVATMTHKWEDKFTQANLAKAFFWFGLVCGVMAVMMQFNAANSTSSTLLFADSPFYFSLATVAILAGIYINTEKRDKR